jgi:hypothetical protein
MNKKDFLVTFAKKRRENIINCIKEKSEKVVV